MVRGVAAASAAVLAVGCLVRGGPSPSKPVVEFPSAARLAAVESKPVTLPPIQSGEVPPEGWTVAPPEPAPAPAPAPAADPWAPRGPYEETFAAAYTASQRKAALTRPMACAAAEIGRFFLEKQAPPPESLQSFLVAACGVFAPTVSYEWFKGQVPDRAPDEAVLPHWKNQIGAVMVGHLPANAKEVGFWFGRRHGRAVALVAHQSAPVELKPLSPVPDFNGDLAIEGRLEGGDASYFAGYVNQGRFGVKRCLVDPSVLRPSFRVSCRVAADDETAWIQIVYAPPRSVLAQPIVQVLARRDPRKPLVYTQVPYAPSRPVTDAVSFGPAVLVWLNATRALAGLPPVRLAETQSATASRVARHYFAAALGPMGDGASGALDDLNTIALGLLAGWQVVGTIRDGTFFSTFVPRTRDAGRWVDAALSMPIGRIALMAPEIDEVAIGSALFDEPQAIGAIACGYRFHRDNDHTADVNHLLERITAARQRINLPPPVRLKGMDAVLRRELTRVQEGKGTPMTALQASLREASERNEAPTRGIVVEATSLDALEIPPQVLSQAHLQLEVGVTHYKPPGAAWAQLVIVVVYVSPRGLSI